MEANRGELQRLANQHETYKSAMGTLTVAPVDFSGPALRILDSGTADGLSLSEISVPHFPLKLTTSQDYGCMTSGELPATTTNI
jgi:hypothetical protein